MSTSGETPDHIAVDDADDLRADIANTRAELADTLDHLMAKLDVKGRARHQLHDVKGRARHQLHDVKAATQQRMAQLPKPVHQAAGGVGKLARQARPYRKHVLIAVGGVLVAAVLARRFTR